MHGNFDCTQLISIQWKQKELESTIKNLFECQGFEIIGKEKIAPKKIEYFQSHLFDSVFELKNDNFMGEFEDWIEKSNPPCPISRFIKSLNSLVMNEQILELTIFLIYFADLDGSSSCNIKAVTVEEITEILFTLSDYYYGVRYDNLILKLLMK